MNEIEDLIGISSPSQDSSHFKVEEGKEEGEGERASPSRYR